MRQDLNLIRLSPNKEGKNCSDLMYGLGTCVYTTAEKNRRGISHQREVRIKEIALFGSEVQCCYLCDICFHGIIQN
jgi:hypothetical protein